MTKRTKAPARILATLALVGAFILVIVVLSNALSSDDSDTKSVQGKSEPTKTSTKQDKKTPTAYVVQNGDTLTSISEKTGVSVDVIQQLNPDLDPQILNSGQKLKLR